MTNREKYKQAFSALHTSDDFSLEVLHMKTNRKFRMTRAMAVCAAVVMLMGCLTAVAYASGALSQLRLWINGQEVDPSSYVSYDQDGNLTVEMDVDEDSSVTGGENSMVVSITDGEDAPEAGQLPVDVAYENRAGRDYLIFTNLDTGETQEMDITGEVVDGRYEDTVTVLGMEGQVALEIYEDGCLSVTFSTGDEDTAQGVSRIQEK